MRIRLIFNGIVCLFSKMESGYLYYYCNEKFGLFNDIFNHIIEKYNAETFKITKLKLCGMEGVLGYTTVYYKFKPLDTILAGKNVLLAEPDSILINDSISIETPCPSQSKRFRRSSNANTSMEFDSDEEDITTEMLELFIQGVEPSTHAKSTQSESSTNLSDLLSIIPATIASLKDAAAQSLTNDSSY